MANNPKLRASLAHLVTKTPPKTETVLSLFLVATILLLTTSMMYVVNLSLKDNLHSVFLNTHEDLAKSKINEIRRYLTTTQQLIEQYSKQHNFAQAFEQANESNSQFKDALASNEHIGADFIQTLYNAQGHRYLNTGHPDNKENLGSDVYDTYKQIFEGSLSSQIMISQDQTSLLLATAISSADGVKGLLLTEIPSAALSKALNIDGLSDIGITLQIGSRKIAWGEHEHVENGSTLSSEGDILYSYTIGTKSLNDAIYLAQVRLALMALGIAIIAIFVSNMIGRRFFIRPLERLKHFAAKISLGSDPRLESTPRKTREIQLLSDTIESMAKKIFLREKELRKANTHLKQHQDSLVQQEKMASLGQVMAGVAHEINNPIGFIMNNLTMMQEYHEFLLELTEQLLLLKQRTEKNEDTHELLLEIDKTLQKENLQFLLDDLGCITSESIDGTQRVKEIVKGLKGYAHNSETPSMVDISESIESTLRVVWNEIKYNCQVSKHFEHQSRVLCIGGQINQVLMNIIINAAQAMEEQGGQLDISTEEMCDCVVIKISDNGPGIKPEHLDKIFDPFFTTKPVGQGTGLGMSICYDIIKNHGGQIEIESEPGEGTTFTVVLPIQPLVRLKEDGTEAA
jgi:signal transduction histidine kinase